MTHKPRDKTVLGGLNLGTEAALSFEDAVPVPRDSSEVDGAKSRPSGIGRSKAWGPETMDRGYRDVGALLFRSQNRKP